MRGLAVFLLVGFSPIILLSMLLVRITSSGPALFRQTRLGKDGRLFEVLKIRTMYCNAEDLSGPVLCQPGDSRITPIGKLLRFLHLDELPQLVNVVRGEMCLVGPRPERPAIIARHRLNDIVPGFAERTKVLPGVTGLAQINLPADQTAESVIPKVQLDLEYISSSNVSLDLRILLCTAMRMIGVRHGRAVRLLGLHRSILANFGPTHVREANELEEVSQWSLSRHLHCQSNGSAALACTSGSGAYREISVRPYDSTGFAPDDLSTVEADWHSPEAMLFPRKPH
jgi:lipopolysaccharide/colanic/teichoic acid biosynthesis glycosyltransferase